MKNAVYLIETDSQKKAGGEGSDKNISVGKNVLIGRILR